MVGHEPLLVWPRSWALRGLHNPQVGKAQVTSFWGEWNHVILCICRS